MIQRIFHKTDKSFTWGIDLIEILDPNLKSFSPDAYGDGIRFKRKYYRNTMIKTLYVTVGKYSLTIWKSKNLS